MKALTDVNFNGCISDQTHRMYMPTALPLITMGNTLFDKDTDFAKLKDDYFASAFGKDGFKVRDFLDALSPLLSPSNFRVGGKGGMEEAGVGFGDSKDAPFINNTFVAERADKIPALIDSFEDVVGDNVKASFDPAQRLSWMYLELFLPIARYHGEILKAAAIGDLDSAKAILDRSRDYISENELRFHGVFDLFLYVRAVAQKIGYKLPGYFD